MNCTYVRQLSDNSPYEYLQKPEDFKNSDELEYYKNIVFFTNPTEFESKLYVHTVGYESATPDKNSSGLIHQNKTAFHYVVSGEGYFNGRAVKRGDCFIAQSNTPYGISAKKGKNFEFCWILISHQSNFSIADLGFDPQTPIFKYNFEAEIRQAVYSLQTFSPKKRDIYFFTLGKFFEIISYHNATDTIADEGKSPTVSNARYVSLITDMLEESEYKISIEELAKAIGFSRKYLSMIFCQTMGITLRDYVTKKKIERAKRMLLAGEASLKTIAFQLNYNDYSSFSRAFKKESGLTPHEYVSVNKK